ncbi:MAG: glutamate racemase [Candidatus Kerfeldbacteria bacterium]|nr:glutamate racemase [Candidatus Kerfeldbacteria bacterium]
MIGVFDSGIGGLTVVKELRKQLPDYQLAYFGDTARTPYGNKSTDTVIQYAKENTEFLIAQGAQIIVIACNTASAVATESLRAAYPQIPFFEVITPAAEAAARHSTSGHIGVIGTRTTINSDIYQKTIASHRPQASITSKACPLFVPLAEEGWINDQITKITARRYLTPLKRHQIDTLILGCTHYPILRNVIQQKIGKRVFLIDPAVPTVAALRQYLTAHPELEQSLPKNPNHQYYFSDIPSHMAELAQRWLWEPVKPQLHRMH